MSVTFLPSKPIKRLILRVFNYTVHNFYSLQMMILYIVNDTSLIKLDIYVRQLMNTTTQVCEYIYLIKLK